MNSYCIIIKYITIGSEVYPEAISCIIDQEQRLLSRIIDLPKYLQDSTQGISKIEEPFNGSPFLVVNRTNIGVKVERV